MSESDLGSEADLDISFVENPENLPSTEGVSLDAFGERLLEYIRSQYVVGESRLVITEKVRQQLLEATRSDKPALVPIRSSGRTQESSTAKNPQEIRRAFELLTTDELLTELLLELKTFGFKFLAEATAKLNALETLDPKLLGNPLEAPDSNLQTEFTAILDLLDVSEAESSQRHAVIAELRQRSDADLAALAEVVSAL